MDAYVGIWYMTEVTLQSSQEKMDFNKLSRTAREPEEGEKIQLHSYINIQKKTTGGLKANVKIIGNYPHDFK